MGTLIITVQMSADASIGPEMGWFDGGEDDSEARGADELRLAGALVLGRKTYEGLAAYWPNASGELAFNLVKPGLADEVRFWVHPIVWGEPSRPFHGLGHVRMRHKDTTVFHSGSPCRATSRYPSRSELAA